MLLAVLHLFLSFLVLLLLCSDGRVAGVAVVVQAQLLCAAEKRCRTSEPKSITEY